MGDGNSCDYEDVCVCTGCLKNVGEIEAGNYQELRERFEENGLDQAEQEEKLVRALGWPLAKIDRFFEGKSQPS
jgi:hypothetical protein